MKWTNSDILVAEKVFRLNVVNSVTGIKTANLIGTRDRTGSTNLALFSSVVHLGSNPPLVGFFLRPHQSINRHSYDNIRETGEFTVNHVPHAMIEQAHWTSAKFARDTSEFDVCGFTPEYHDGFGAPFVAESGIKFGLRFRQAIDIDLNATTLVIGEIELMMIPDSPLGDDGFVDLEAAGSVGVSGLNSYYTFTKTGEFPYARAEEVPDFS